jgi:hypothetical protein
VENSCRLRLVVSIGSTGVLPVTIMSATMEPTSADSAKVSSINSLDLQEEDKTPIDLHPHFLPLYCIFPQICNQWKKLNGNRFSSVWFIWPDCKVSTLKIIFSCFLVNVAPANLSICMTKKRGSFYSAGITLDEDSLISEAPDLFVWKNGSRGLSISLKKNKECDWWDSYRNTFQYPHELIPKPKIEKELLETAKMMMEDAWLDYVKEHWALLEEFFEYNEKAWKESKLRIQWEEHLASKKNPYLERIINEFIGRRQKLADFRMEVEKRQEQEDDKENRGSLIARVDYLYFQGRPRSC